LEGELKLLDLPDVFEEVD
jgi:hypothetical protein